ncbi:MAG: hypothetical protein DCC49_07270 [Acidobacteria bacterium]|nr:MAG: hypothetical protein DCC49_07270 [Acidobacteriota bacterium]
MESTDEARDASAGQRPRSRRPWRALAISAGVFLFYAVVALAVATPHRAHLADTIVGDTGDPSLFMWSWRWESHILATGDFGQFWRGNYFYPYRYPVAYTEHVVALMPLYAFFEWATGNSIAALNLVYVSLFALAGSFGCLLGRAVTKSWPGGLFAGLAFGFSPFRFGQITHYHIAAIFATAAAFVLLKRLVDRPRPTTAGGLGLLWALQMLMSFYLGAICLVGMGAYLVVALFQARGRRAVRTVALAGAGIGLGILLVLPLTLPYLTVVRTEIKQERSITEIGHYSTNPRLLVRPHGSSILYGRILGLSERESNWELQLFVGLALGLMSAVGFATWRDPVGADAGDEPGDQDTELGDQDTELGGASPHRSRIKALLAGEQTRWAAVGATGLIFSFGPYVAVPGIGRPIPLPYRFLMFVPGFKGLRVPSRFAVLFYLGLAVLGAMGVAWLWRRGRAGKAGVVALSLLLLAEFGVSLPVTTGLVGTAEQMPSYVAWLREAPPGPVIEMPIYREGVTGAVRQGYRQYVSTFDWKPRVNGYSGYFPVGYKEFVEVMRGFPDEASISALEEREVRYVLVHFNEYDAPGEGGQGLPTAAQLQSEISTRPELVPVHDSYPAVVYELRSPAPK